MFSVSGFEDSLEEYAESNGIALFGVKELIGDAPLPEIRPVSLALRRWRHRLDRELMQGIFSVSVKMLG